MLGMEMSEEGLAAAKQWCRWHIGDATWAAGVIDAYLNPQEAMADLADEMAESEEPDRG